MTNFLIDFFLMSFLLFYKALAWGDVENFAPERFIDAEGYCWPREACMWCYLFNF